jgi:hypothetical protein
MNPSLAIATEGNDPVAAADRLGELVDQIIRICPDATILLAMIISTCDPNQQPRTAQYQGLIPEVARKRQVTGHKVIAVDFTSFSLGDLRDCIHPTNQGYRIFGSYWYDFITQIPSDWISAPVGSDPSRPLDENINANGGLDGNIPAPNWGNNPVSPSSKVAIFQAAMTAGNGGARTCNSLPVWQSTGQIALGLGRTGDWHFKKNWVQAGKVADGVHLDHRHVRQVIPTFPKKGQAN